jgi:protein TonB
VSPPEPEPESSPITEVQPPAPPAKPKVVERTPEKRPERKVKRPKKEIERQAKRPEKPQRPKRQTQTEVARADRGPEPIPGAGTGSASTAKNQSRGGGDASASRSSRNAEAAYLAELQRAIARHQQFPSEARRKRQTGVTTLSFVVQRDGRIRQVRVTKSSGNASLDEAAMTAMKRLSRFKPIPAVIDRQEWPMRVPIRFDLR